MEMKFDELMYIVIPVPKDAEKLIVRAKLPKKKKAVTELSREGVAAARDMYLELDPYDDAFVYYALTDRSKELLQQRRIND